jgi:hypothetical protein
MKNISPAAAPFRINGRECYITLEARPKYCDRGNWIAKIFAEGALAREMDHADMWPRYYFDLYVAMQEIRAWLQKRGQFVTGEFFTWR